MLSGLPPSRPEPADPRPRFWPRLWRQLTEPSDSIVEPERRRRARLLSVILLVLLALALLASLFDGLRDRSLSTALIFDLAFFLMLGFVFGLSRTPYDRWAARLVVAIPAGALLISLYGLPADSMTLYFAILPLLLGSLFLYPHGILILWLVSLLELLGLYLIGSRFDGRELYDATYFMLVAGALMCVGGWIRQRDLTQIHEQSAKLAANESYFHSLIANASDIILVLDARGVVQFASPSVERVLGYTPAELVGKRATDLVKEEDAKRIPALIAGIAEANLAGRTVQMPVRHKDGTWRVLEAVGKKVEGAADPAMVVNARDVTEREAAQAALKANERRFRALIENASDGITLLDAHGTVLYTGPSTHRILGGTEEWWVGGQWLNRVYAADRPRVARSFEQLVREPGASQTVEFRYQRFDGSWIWLEAVGTNLLAEPSVQAIVGNFRDITSRKQAEQEMRQRNAQLAALNEFGQTLAQLATPDQIVRMIYTDIGRVLDNRNLCIALCDEKRQTLTFPLWAFEGQVSSLPARPFDNGVVENVILTRTPLFTVQEVQDTFTLLGIERLEPMPQSLMAVPLVAGERVLGAILVQDNARSLAYQPTDLEVLTTLAAQASIALENARLYASIQQELAERQRAEETLTKERNILRALIDNVPDYMYVKDTDSRFVLGNLALARSFGKAEPEEIYGKSDWDFHRPEYASQFYADEQTIVRTGQALINREEYILEPAGEKKWFITTKMPLRDSQGRIIGLVAVGRDITERKRAEREIQRRAEEFAALYDAGLALNSVLDLHTQISALFKIAARALQADRVEFWRVDTALNEARLELGYAYRAIEKPDHLSLPLDADRGLVPWVVHYRRPLYLPDVKADPRWINLDVALHSALWVPVRRDNRTQGVLAVMSTRLDAFSAQDERLLSLFANQAAIALENADLFKEAHHRAEQLQAINAVAQSITTMLDPGPLLTHVVRSIRSVLNLHNVSIALFEGETLAWKAGDGHHVEGHFTPIPHETKEEDITAWVARTGESVLIPDVRADPRCSHWTGGAEVRAELCVPIRAQGRILGVLEIQSDRSEAFATEDIPLFESLAAHIAVAIENARLFEDLHQRLDELEAVSRISTAMREAQTLEEMYPILLDETRAVLGVASASLWLYDPVQDQLREVAARGLAPIPVPVKPGEGIAGYVFASGVSFVSADFRSDPRTNDAAREHVPPGLAGAVVPVRSEKETIGVLFVSDSALGDLASRIRVLVVIAEITGNAIRRMRLHEQTTQQVERLMALHQVDRAITASLDLNLSLNAVLDQATAQLQVDAAAILLLDSRSNTLEYTAGRGFRYQAITAARLRFGEGLAGRAAQERRTLGECVGRKGRPMVETNPWLQGEGFVSSFAVPLLVKGQVKGVLQVFQRCRLEPSPEWQNFLETLAGQAAIAIDNSELFDGLQRSNQDLALAYDTTIEGWSRALDLRDRETEGHTQRVTEMSVRLARALGIPEIDIVHIRRGALLHDIGKMGIPDNILLKPGTLTEQEWEIMRKHPVFAYELLAPVAYLRPALDIPYAHHEKWDGTGYPRGLKGEEIPLPARLFAIVDVWDALRSDRPYRPAWSEDRVREYLREQAGKHFDPRVVEAFLDIIQ